MCKTNYCDEKHIIPFFVGLMDGDGSIQVNHWRKKMLQFRWVIKLKSHPQNHVMLTLLSEVIGGSVRENSGFLYWSENHQRRLRQLIPLLQKYPPLTKRLQCQLTFFQEALLRKDVDWYLAQRAHKYEQPTNTQQRYTYQNITSLHPDDKQVFASWCSGFIEAEGCFTQRKNGWSSFSIAQKDECQLMENIRDYFGGINRVRKCLHNIYLWEVYKQSVLQNICNHCKFYPLLGQKRLAWEKFNMKNKGQHMV